MKKASFQEKQYKTVLGVVSAIPNKRTQDILDQRFGLSNGQRQTLEAVGQKYNITRERVRQIEEAAFKVIRDDAEKVLKPIYQLIGNYFSKEGNLVREERLLEDLTGSQDPHPHRGALYFVLSLGKPYQRYVESKEFHPIWVNAQSAYKKATDTVLALVKKLEKEASVVPVDYVISYGKSKGSSFSQDALFSYLDATKLINQNNFGYFGLANWSEISPRGVKDKAYIIFKQKGEPLHFREVADLINEAQFDSSDACPQTVHNELIKDGRFVLVGRGTYALTEWGYQPGTVKEVIASLIKESGALPKKDILDQVMQNRLVKENTVLINLQNRKFFIRGEDGRYRLNNK